MTPETELARLFRAAADEYAEQLKRTPTPDAPEPMEMERARAALGAREAGMVDLAGLVRKRLRQYDSLRDASRHIGLGHVYLHRLATGKKKNPSDDALLKLGIRRTVRVTYKEIP